MRPAVLPRLGISPWADYIGRVWYYESRREMEPEPQEGEPLSEQRRHVRRVHSRIPVDTVLWALLFWVLLPLAISHGWFHPVNATLRSAFGDKVLVWLSVCFGSVGTLILAVVRYPLYVRRHHHGFRPRELPHQYRPTFWVSYMLIVVGTVILFTLVFKQHLM
jgi:hypothetical protein